MTFSEKIKQAGQKITQIKSNKRRALLVSAVASAVIVGGTGVAYADNDDHDRKDDKHRSAVVYTGPVETSSVADVLADTSWFSDSKYILEGHIIKQLSDRTFLFTDGAGELVIELRRRSDLTFSDKDRVRIKGEYETEFWSDDKFEVKQLTVL